MKIAARIAAALLGLLFVVTGVMYMLDLVPMPPPPPEGTPIAKFGSAMWETGYMTFVKILEITGGLLVMIPRTRAIGLLILTPVIVNIIAFGVFIAGGEGLFNPLYIFIVSTTIFLIWTHRRGLAALATDPA